MFFLSEGVENHLKNAPETTSSENLVPRASWKPFGGHFGSQNRSGRGSENKQKFGTNVLLIFGPPSKPTTTPVGGGAPSFRTWVLEHFSLKSLLAPRRGAKIEVPGFQGPLLGLGGEAKASPTTSKLVV